MQACPSSEGRVATGRGPQPKACGCAARAMWSSTPLTNFASLPREGAVTLAGGRQGLPAGSRYRPRKSGHSVGDGRWPICLRRLSSAECLMCEALLVTPHGAPWAPRPRVTTPMVKALVRALCRSPRPYALLLQRSPH